MMTPRDAGNFIMRAIAASILFFLMTSRAHPQTAGRSVMETGTNYIDGSKKFFSAAPYAPSPSVSTQLANKAYVDTAISGVSAVTQWYTNGVLVASTNKADFIGQGGIMVTGQLVSGVMTYYAVVTSVYASASITNGFLVSSDTNGFVSASITNGLVGSLTLGSGLAGNITAGVLSVTNTSYRVFNVRDYGAKGDGVKLLDAWVNSGANLVSSPSSGFSNALAGMTLELAGAATSGGPSTGPLITTITSVVSSAAVYVADNAATSVTNAVCKYSSDDTVAISNTVNAAISAGGGNVYFPDARIYGVHAGLTTGTFANGTAYSGQIVIPPARVTNQAQTIRFVGDVSAPLSGALGIGTVLWSTVSNGNVFAVANTAAVSGGQQYESYVFLIFENLNFWTACRPTGNPVVLYLAYSRGAYIRNCMFVHYNMGTVASLSTNNIAVYLPSKGNSDFVSIEDVRIANYGTGVNQSEHVWAKGISVQSCRLGWQIGNSFGSAGNSYLPSTWTKVFFHNNLENIRVVSDGGSSKPILYGDIATENVSNTTNDLNDVGNILLGTIVYSRLDSAPAWVQVGGTNATVVDYTVLRWPMKNIVGGDTIITNVTTTVSGLGVSGNGTHAVIVTGTVSAASSYTNTFTGPNTTGSVVGASSSTGKFLKDDGTWATASGSGGAYPIQNPYTLASVNGEIAYAGTGTSGSNIISLVPWRFGNTNLTAYSSANAVTLQDVVSQIDLVPPATATNWGSSTGLVFYVVHSTASSLTNQTCINVLGCSTNVTAGTANQAQAIVFLTNQLAAFVPGQEITAIFTNRTWAGHTNGNGFWKGYFAP